MPQGMKGGVSHTDLITDRYRPQARSLITGHAPRLEERFQSRCARSLTPVLR